MFIKELFTKKFIQEYFNRNKKLIILSATIFILSIILGVIFSESFEQLTMVLIQKMLENIPTDTVSGNAINLFINNITANYIILAAGLLFSIISVFSIITNGVLIGYLYTLTTPSVFFVGIIPHGIFELTALILSLTGAFIITKVEIKLIQALFGKRLRKELENTKSYIKDIIFTIITTFVLLVIAAIIEAAITPVLLQMVM